MPGERTGPFGFVKVPGMTRHTEVYALVRDNPPKVFVDADGLLHVEHATHIISTLLVTFSEWKLFPAGARIWDATVPGVIAYTSGDAYQPFRDTGGKPRWWGETRSSGVLLNTRMDERPTREFASEFEAAKYAEEFNQDSLHRAKTIESTRTR